MTSGSSAIIIATSSLRLSPCDRAASERLALVGERHSLQVVLGALDQLACGCDQHRQHVQAGAGARLHREAHVLNHRQVREQIGQLEGAADAAPRARGGAEARDVLAVEEHLARGGRQLARHQVEVGGLAGPVGPTIAVSVPG